MWKVIRSSEVGTSHIEANQTCQDSCFAGVFQGEDAQDYLVCIVSDGAGSAIKGGEGAELACEMIAKSVEIALSQVELIPISELLVQEWIRHTQKNISQTASSLGLTARDYACTLLGAVIGLKQAIFFQIGDGAIVVSNSGCSQGVVFWPDAGIYANMTYFVTDEEALQHLHVSVITASIDEVAIFSDGLQRLALSFENRIPHIPFFEPMFTRLRESSIEECEALDSQLSKFLQSTQINERTDDDKTLILATRRML